MNEFLIPDSEISQIIKKMCEQSQSFQNFYRNEIPKLNGKTISWIHNPTLSTEGYADSRNNQIILKNHPSELLKEGNYFLICHEISHLIQKEEKCPVIRFHPEILRYLSSSHTEREKISAFVNSIIYDFSINVKLKQYGIEIFSKFLEPSKGERSPAFKLSYIFRYVIFQRNMCLFDRMYEQEAYECLKKYNDNNLVEIGDKILEIIYISNLSDLKGFINSDTIKPVIEKIFTEDVFNNLMKFFQLPYKFKLTVTQTGENILINSKELF